MINFSFKEDEKLYGEIAEQIAKDIYGNGYSPQTNKNQIRNFYEKVLEIYEDVFIDKKEFNKLLPKIKMLSSKVEYAKGRKNIKGDFIIFMHQCIKMTNTKEDLEVFKLLFESVLGFFVGIDFEKEEEKKQQRGRR